MLWRKALWKLKVKLSNVPFPVPLSHLRRPQLSGDQGGVPARWQPAHLDGGPRHGHHAVGPVLKLGATVLFPECVRAKFRRPCASISEKKFGNFSLPASSFGNFFSSKLFLCLKKKNRNFNRKQLGIIIWFNSKKIKGFWKFCQIANSPFVRSITNVTYFNILTPTKVNGISRETRESS